MLLLFFKFLKVVFWKSGGNMEDSDIQWDSFQVFNVHLSGIDVDGFSCRMRRLKSSR